ncbi:hypothetical protein LZ30DRAFT_719254 [Colletotrichum cereale]|nr:hypothetical protein LZ30DRAFT_719254 [Colletotrichum cereale]
MGHFSWPVAFLSLLKTEEAAGRLCHDEGTTRFLRMLTMLRWVGTFVCTLIKPKCFIPHGWNMRVMDVSFECCNFSRGQRVCR